MSKDIEKVAQEVAKEFKWPNKGTLLLAVSGGPDSTLMTIVMKRVSEIMGFNAHIVHVDHCLRGKSSLQDSQFVRKLAVKNKMGCTVKRVDIPTIMESESGSTQEICRNYRLNYIKKLAKKMNAFGVAYGHNKNDQGETLLMNLIRGSGTNGLAGMDSYNIEDGLTIIRPIINLYREDIIKLLDDNNQAYRTDESNLKDDYTRNHIRHNLIPFIEKNYNNNFIDALSRTSKIISIDNEYLEKTVKKYFDKYFHIDTGAIYVNINDIDNLHLSIKLRLFRLAFETLTGSMEELTYNHSLDMVNSIREAHNYSISLPSNIKVRRIYEKIYIHKKDYFKVEDVEKKLVEMNREICFDKARLKFYQTNKKDIGKNMYIFDYDKISFPLYLRKRKPGDRIQPFGMEGTKKIKDLMIDKKILPYKREVVPILVDSNDKVLAVINIRRSNYALVDDKTDNILVCEFLEVPQWIKI